MEDALSRDKIENLLQFQEKDLKIFMNYMSQQKMTILYFF